MTSKTAVKSRILATVHETASDLHNAGFIDLRRMREYDALCLAPVPEYSVLIRLTPRPTRCSGSGFCGSERGNGKSPRSSTSIATLAPV